jgi:multidrug efflux pump subunit AcrA (membrane-fusion protein)
MKKTSNRNFILGIFIFIFLGAIAWINLFPSKISSDSEIVAVKKVGNQILADGTVNSQNTANLHFQVGGKLAYLPLKEGDQVYAGQTIASLDTYTVQRQLTIALNNYRSTRDTFDQTKDNTQNGVSVGQQKYAIEKAGLSGISGQGEVDVINDIIKRLADQSQASLDNSVTNVELANYALQLSSLTSPIDGVITHLDVTTSGVNITPTTSFIVSDPDNLVFDANVSESMINYISIGNAAKIKITNGGEVTGNITKIYPQKMTFPTGENGYAVEISVDNLNSIAKMGQSGTVSIESSLSDNSIVVPSWTVLGKKSVWVLSGDKFILKTVKVGRIMGKETEILEGLNFNDKIILNPKSIATKSYKLL